jgi:hypothetical protein
LANKKRISLVQLEALPRLEPLKQRDLPNDFGKSYREASYGGWGSGKRWSSKNTTSGYLRLDIRRLQQRHCLGLDKSFSWYWTLNDQPYADIQIRSQYDRIVLSYRHHIRSEDWQSKEYPVLLTQTPCHFGGVRQWFLCPARGWGDVLPFSMAARYSPAEPTINSLTTANAKSSQSCS